MFKVKCAIAKVLVPVRSCFVAKAEADIISSDPSTTGASDTGRRNDFGRSPNSRTSKGTRRCMRAVCGA